MEWNRGVRPNQPAGQPGPQVSGPAAPAAKTTGKKLGFNGNKLANLALFGGAAILLLATLLFVVKNADRVIAGEKGLVDNKKMQAVFLNGGQVYFGQIKDLNDKYMRVDGIYYLRVNQQVQPNQAENQQSANDISLVKLGCELHGPEDSMVIYRDQIIFWENLKTDGQVAKAVEQYKKDNPQGQKCDEAAAQQQSTPATPEQNNESSSDAPATSTPPATTPSPTAPNTNTRR